MACANNILAPSTTDLTKTSAPFSVIAIGRLLLVRTDMLGQDVEESVRGATSRKYRLCTYLHDHEENLLPYLDRNALHVESKRLVFGRCGVVFCLEPFARLLLDVTLHNCGKLAVPLLTAATCLARPRTVTKRSPHNQESDGRRTRAQSAVLLHIL